MEARIATPGEATTASHYSTANFKLGEINTAFKLENRKNLNHFNIRYRLNVQKVFC